jgi:hypothetical protein
MAVFIGGGDDGRLWRREQFDANSWHGQLALVDDCHVELHSGLRRAG